MCEVFGQLGMDVGNGSDGGGEFICEVGCIGTDLGRRPDSTSLDLLAGYWL